MVISDIVDRRQSASSTRSSGALVRVVLPVTCFLSNLVRVFWFATVALLVPSIRIEHIGITDYPREDRFVGTRAEKK